MQGKAKTKKKKKKRTPIFMDKLPSKYELEVALAERKLAHYVRQAWHIVEPKRELIWNWHLDAIGDHLEAVTANEIHYLLINIPPRFTKPVWVGSKVLTSSGRRKKLSQIKIGDEVLTHKSRFRKVTAIHKQGVLPILQIKTHKGRTLYSAYDHPFLTPTGWKKAEDLLLNDVLGVPVPKFKKQSKKDIISKEEARLIGYFVGDVSTANNMSSITAFDKDVSNDIFKCCKKLGFTAKWSKAKFFRSNGKRNRINISNGSREWLRRFNLYNKTSYDKRVPSILFLCDLKTIKEFIVGYFMCDGTLNARSSDRWDILISLTSVHKKLLEDIQHLFLRFNINTRIRERINTHNEFTKNGNYSKRNPGRNKGLYLYYMLEFSTQDDVDRFRRLIPIYGDKKKRLDSWPIKRKNFDQNIQTDYVVEVKPYGERECACLTVEEDHSFTIEDVAVKNSINVSVMWPTWEWGPRNMPYIRYVYSSYAQDLATRDAVKSRRIILSEWYQQRWGDRFVVTSDQNQKTKYENNFTGFRLATSVRGVITGEGGDRIVVDDPHNIKEAESDKIREDTNTWWDESMSTRLDDEDNGAYVIIAQRSHSNDLCGHVIKKWEAGEIPDLVKLILPARYEKERELSLQTRTPLPSYFEKMFDKEKEDDLSDATKVLDAGLEKRKGADKYDPRTEEGESLDKNRWPDRKLRKREARMGEYAVAGQLQQRPSPRGGGMFEVAKFQIITYPIPNQLIERKVRYWDKACLVANTKIETKSGIKNIQDITTDDFVLTRKGYKRVLKSWLSKYTNELVTVLFSDGKTIIGTPDHKVLVNNNEWKELKDLSNSDQLYTKKDLLWQDQEIQMQKKGSLMEDGMLDTQTQNILPKEGIFIVTNGIRRLINMIIDHCMVMFGNTTMERYPKAIIYITKTKIGITVKSKILNVSRSKNIEGFMQKIYRMKLLWQIQSIEKKLLKLFKKQYKEKRGTSVKSVVFHSQQKASKQNIAQVVELKEQEKEIETELGIGVPVYDLTINGEHEFFANGILVHNSTEGGGCLTAGVLLYKMKKDFIGPKFIIADATFGQWKSEIREARIKQTAQIDGTDVYVWHEQEGGSGGKESAENTTKNLSGFRVQADKVSGSKEVRAEPFSNQVNVGNVGLVQASWNKEFIDQHEVFPMGSRKKDMVDSVAGAFNKAELGNTKRAGVW